ncbi:MAG: hypothetical protein KJ957_01880 [Candidatus Omnitrophica bacterium]|nr:hypothetical protein [Candidatus Omnitrophota bacterium]
MSEFIRVWKNVDMQDISSHLLIVGEIKGECSGCRALGIDYREAKTCPQCNASFKYIASRTKEVKRIKERRPDLIFIDFEDYKKVLGKIKARDFLS